MFFVPLRLSDSDVLYQTRIVKDDDIQTDGTVLWNIRDQYLEALNPVNQWCRWLYLPTPFKLWIGKISKYRVFNRRHSNGQPGFLWRWCCPVFRKLSLWDLKGIKEAKVLYIFGMYLIEFSSKFFMHTVENMLKLSSPNSSKRLEFIPKFGKSSLMIRGSAIHIRRSSVISCLPKIKK
jgi:hypothetical protein